MSSLCLVRSISALHCFLTTKFAFVLAVASIDQMHEEGRKSKIQLPAATESDAEMLEAFQRRRRRQNAASSPPITTMASSSSSSSSSTCDVVWEGITRQHSQRSEEATGKPQEEDSAPGAKDDSGDDISANANAEEAVVLACVSGSSGVQYFAHRTGFPQVNDDLILEQARDRNAAL